MTPTTDEWYFNTLTGEVEHGKASSWTHRMGPYPTQEAAQNAYASARERTRQWDDEDARWGDEQDGDD